ncbi:J domain-containing protein 1 [Aspergillus tubingensis]|uniref:J domain-containing protein 1 n=1 Tax=Aspergillus tubingensis TaxID=5068 RepID=UPI001578B005|nr:J domain-containing protein 1 [Aspergillus tubingensis]GFN11084.1 J domain-containing protein 1 [Aspergillus tubingensis]
MSAEEFLANVDGGIVPVTCHEDVLRIAFIYLHEGLWTGNGVFDVVEKLHSHGLSFGEGDLRYNRSLDIFYLAQLAAAIYRYSSQLEEDFPSFSNFSAFYTAHHALLHSSAWRSYYSTPFITQRTTARFYRLPDLQDLPDSSSPLCQPRQSPASSIHILQLPRWAYTVACTHRRQPFLPFATLTSLALSTLETTMRRRHTANPSAPSYSESHARFWLDYFTPDTSPPSRVAGVTPRQTEGPDRFGILVAQGMYDIHGLETEYLVQISGGEGPDGDSQSEQVIWCGWPDGGIGVQAWWRGWEGEVGSEEEVEFLAAVAVEETLGLGLQGIDMNELDLSIRSHILLAVMHATVKDRQERERFLGELERRMVQEELIDRERAGAWVREALEIMEPYVREWQGVWPGVEERRKMLRRILVENGQLFARWRVSPASKEFTFEMGSRG